jgi:hypothetical protein
MSQVLGKIEARAGFPIPHSQVQRAHRKCPETTISKMKLKKIFRRRNEDATTQEIQAEILGLKIEVASTSRAPISAMKGVVLVAGIKND